MFWLTASLGLQITRITLVFGATQEARLGALKLVIEMQINATSFESARPKVPVETPSNMTGESFMFWHQQQQQFLSTVAFTPNQRYGRTQAD